MFGNIVEVEVCDATGDAMKCHSLVQKNYPFKNRDNFPIKEFSNKLKLNATTYESMP